MVSSWAKNTFASLSDPHYRILWAGTTISFLAFAMSWVVQGVVAFDLTGRNGDVGTVAVGMGLATILTAPFGGVIADRISKRLLLLVGQALIAITFGLVALLIYLDAINIPLLVLSTFVQGLVFSFIAPARQAWIGELLTGVKLSNAIALQQVGMTATRIVGPWMSVALIAAPFLGTGGAYAVMGGLITLCLVTLFQMPDSKPSPRAGRASAMADLKGGIAHVSSRPRLALLAASFIAIVIAGFSYQVLLPGYLDHELNRSTRDMGWMLGVAGAAGLVATLAVASLANSRHAWGIMMGGGVALAAGLVLLAFAGSFAAVLAVMLLVGGGQAVFQMLNNALMMQESDPAYYGRVMSLTMLAWGFNSLAGLPFGFLADGIGERRTLLIMGMLVVVVLAGSAVARRATVRLGASRLSKVASQESAPTRP